MTRLHSKTSTHPQGLIVPAGAYTHRTGVTSSNDWFQFKKRSRFDSNKDVCYKGTCLFTSLSFVLSSFLSFSYVTMNLCLVPRSISHLMILLLSTFVLLIYHFFPLHCVLPTPLFFYFPPACIICIYPTLFPLSSSISLQLLDFASLSSPLEMPSFLLTFSPGHSSSLWFSLSSITIILLGKWFSATGLSGLFMSCFRLSLGANLLSALSLFLFQSDQKQHSPLLCLSILSPCLPFSFSPPSFPPFHSSPFPPYTFHFLRGQRLWSCSDWILLPSHLNTWKLVTSVKQRPQSLLSPNIPTPLLIFYRQDASGIKHLSSPAVNRLCVREKMKKITIWSHC